MFKQKYVDGIIITAHGSNSELYIDSKIPIVALDRISDSSLPTVVSNNYDGARNATKLLLQKGAKNLAHIRGPQGITPADDRYQGFIDEMKEQHFDYIIEESAFELKAAEKLAENFFNTHAQVDGIFCSSDAIAVGFLKVALKRGIKIPQDVQIIGFDGVAFGEMIYPELTTVAQPIYDMGALATRLLIKIINGKETEQLKYEIPTKMIERGTTK